MAATYDVTDGGATNLMEMRQNVGVWFKKFKLQDLVTTDAGAGTIAEVDDIFQLVNIPPRTTILMAGIIPTVADGAVLTADLGDGDEDDGWVNGVDLNTTTALATVVGDDFGVNSVMGKYYATADTLDLTIETIGAQTTHSSEFIVWAIMFQVPNSF